MSIFEKIMIWLFEEKRMMEIVRFNNDGVHVKVTFDSYIQ
jgi:hypothetical protein